MAKCDRCPTQILEYVSKVTRGHAKVESQTHKQVLCAVSIQDTSVFLILFSPKVEENPARQRF